jgi:ABC-2 type transport system permease protein
MSLRLNKDVGWRLFARTAIGRAYPRVIGQQRLKTGLVIDTFLPTIALSAYVLLLRAMAAPDVLIGFVILGGVMTAFWLNVIWTMASQLFWEKENGNLALYIMAPGPLMAILLGMAVGGLFSATLRALVILAVGSWLFDVQYAPSSVAKLTIVLVLMMTALYGLGMMLSSLFLLLGREAWHMVALAQEPVYLLSGMYFPVRSLPAWLASGASLIPLTLGLDAVRQLLFEPGAALGFLEVNVEIALLAALSVAFVVGSRVSLAHMEGLAVAEGRLTESRG